MDITILRERTSAEHERVEQATGLMDANLDRSRYVKILQRFHGFVAGWEQWSARSPDPEIQRLLQQRLRGALLLADLRWFSVAPSGPLYPGPSLSPDSRAHMLGGLYVMEGSTLGGQYIARHVEAVLPLVPGQGDAFFRGYQQETGRLWQEVREAIRRIPDDEAEEVILSAKTVFQDFARWNEDAGAQQQRESAHA